MNEGKTKMRRLEDVAAQTLGPFTREEVRAYAIATGNKLEVVVALLEMAIHGMSYNLLQEAMCDKWGVDVDKTTWRKRFNVALALPRPFIHPMLRFRASNNLSQDLRIPESIATLASFMTDSFPVPIPHLPTQELRQKYYCFHPRSSASR